MVRRFVVLLAAAFAAAPALAQDKKSSPLPSHLPIGAEACFGRVYDAAHLRAHPKQRVTSFHLLRDFAPDQNSENDQATRQEMLDADGSGGSIGLTVYLRLRDRKDVYFNYFSCYRGDSGAVRCGIDCDGGSFEMRPSGGSLLIENQGFIVIGGCGASDEEQDDPVFVQPGADDKTFRLDKQPLDRCLALREAQKPAWAKLGPPLRERFAKTGALCLVREYDAAHLASHPRQTVKRIAVFKSAAQGSPHEPPQYNLSFRAELRNGRKFEGRTNCWPDDYAYACTHDAELDTLRSFYLTRAGESVMLRDRKGSLGALLKAKLGGDDRMFRLNPAPAERCEF